jgi:ABC-type nitrate/sulfonate/bicarbonate transport system substrate-binding protein
MRRAGPWRNARARGARRAGTTRPWTARAFAVLVAAFAIAGPALAQPSKKAVIGLASPSLPAAGARIAREMGLFDKHGVDVRLTQLESASVATMALLSGSVDFTTASPSDVVLAQARGQKLVAITSVYRSFAGVLVLSRPVADKLAARATSPVAERLKSLDGLLIAAPSATSPYTLALKSAAEGAGAKLRFTFMGQPAMVAALETGAIQGFISSSPFYARPVVNRSGVVWISGPNGDFPPQSSQANSQTLNARREFAEADPDLVQRVAAAFADLSKAVDERPAEVKAALAKLFPDIDSGTLDLLFRTEALGFSTRTLTAADMAREIAFVKLGEAQVPGLDQLDPARLLFP